MSVTSLIASDLAAFSPYRRKNVLRFGDYTVDQKGERLLGLQL
jgi:hypothetical protein